MGNWYLFFFSSRRRHTRCGRDWSSDVCSSDLEIELDPFDAQVEVFVNNERRQNYSTKTMVYDFAEYIEFLSLDFKIGRASCRERVQILVVAVLVELNKCIILLFVVK